MPIVEHRQDPDNEPLGEQIRQRLRALCDFENWPVTDHSNVGGQIAFRPWEAGDPAVDAVSAVLTVHKGDVEQKIAILLLTIRGTISRFVLDQFLKHMTKECARSGVNLSLQNSPSPRSLAGAGEVGGVVMASQESQPPPESLESIWLTIAMTGHSLNADCFYETLVLLKNAHDEVLHCCRMARRR